LSRRGAHQIGLDIRTGVERPSWLVVGVVEESLRGWGKSRYCMHSYDDWNDDALRSNLPVPRTREQAQATTNKPRPVFFFAQVSHVPTFFFCSLVAARVRAFLLAAGLGNRPSSTGFIWNRPSHLFRETLSRHSSILVAQALQTERSRTLPHLHDFRHSDSIAVTRQGALVGSSVLNRDSFCG